MGSRAGSSGLLELVAQDSFSLLWGIACGAVEGRVGWVRDPNWAVLGGGCRRDNRYLGAWLGCGGW